VCILYLSPYVKGNDHHFLVLGSVFLWSPSLSDMTQYFVVSTKDLQNQHGLSFRSQHHQESLVINSVTEGGQGS
jgi:hypothetical protein